LNLLQNFARPETQFLPESILTGEEQTESVDGESLLSRGNVRHQSQLPRFDNRRKEHAASVAAYTSATLKAISLSGEPPRRSDKSTTHHTSSTVCVLLLTVPAASNEKRLPTKAAVHLCCV
jgi:hypothetical protein